jgi:hypothetical protein
MENCGGKITITVKLLERKTVIHRRKTYTHQSNIDQHGSLHVIILRSSKRSFKKIGLFMIKILLVGRQ